MPVTRLIHALTTDPGRTRSHNEDAAAAAAGLGAYIVCDGMGGAAAGEVASSLAVETFLGELAASAPKADQRPGLSRNRIVGGTPKPQTRLHQAVHAANRALFQSAAESPELAGMGTTLVALLYAPGPEKDRRLTPRTAKPKYVTPPTLFLANVGDSRCYRRRGGELQQMSTDHSFVEEQVLAGQITADQAAQSPMRNFITRAIGPQSHVEPDIQSYRPQVGDVYLLASDGLTRELTNEEIGEILRVHLGTKTAPAQTELQEACEALIAKANEHGGRDNITVLLLALL